MKIIDCFKMEKSKIIEIRKSIHDKLSLIIDDIKNNIQEEPKNITENNNNFFKKKRKK